MKRVVLAVVLFAANANADTIWQKAQKPTPMGWFSNDELHRRVVRKLFDTRGIRVNDPIWGMQAFNPLDGALKELERHNAAASADARLRYDLGFVLAKLLRYESAAITFEKAYAFAKDHPLAEDGLFELAICYAKLGKHADEESAYLRALEVTDRASHKALVYSNLSESRMAQGKLEEGIDAAEMAILLEPDMASSRFNLALLKERVGDAAGALEAAKHGVELDPEGEYLTGDGVFFEPAYEKHWYLALRDQALSERELGDARTVLLMRALSEYRQWLDASDPKDRYRPRCEAAIARLEKLLKLTPKKK